MSFLGPKLIEMSRKEGKKKLSCVTYSYKTVLLVSQGKAGKMGGKILLSFLFNFLQRSSQSWFLFVVIRNVCLSDTVIDSFPNKLMETADDELSLVDTGFFINTSYPPLLKSKREVDVILHLNYSGGSQTLVRKAMISEMCFLHGLLVSSTRQLNQLTFQYWNVPNGLDDL